MEGHEARMGGGEMHTMFDGETRGTQACMGG